jgi:uncharacterized membrane protein
VDIAIRALSPAVNDPTTAVQALDQITDLLRRLGSRQLRIGRIKDEHDILRLTFATPTWEDYLSLTFDEIRIYGATSLQVMRRLRTALYDLASEIPLERQAAVRQLYRASQSHGKSFDSRRGRSRASASTRSARIGTFAPVTESSVEERGEKEVSGGSKGKYQALFFVFCLSCFPLDTRPSTLVILNLN